MSVARLMRRYARRRILPALKLASPVRTGRLRRSLGVDNYGEYGIVIGAIRPRYSRALEKATKRRHPGVYGYIVNQKPGRYEGWFTKITNPGAKKMFKRLRREASRIYLGR